MYPLSCNLIRYKSYSLHGSLDYGLLLSAVSQYLYLFKFFLWEIGFVAHPFWPCAWKVARGLASHTRQMQQRGGTG